MGGLFSEGRAFGVQPAVRVFFGPDELVPSPLIAWSKESIFADEGLRTGEVLKLTLNGAYVLPSGSYEQIARGQRELERIFSDDYKPLVLIAGAGNRTLPAGTVIFSGITPRVTNLNVDADIHVNLLRYTTEITAYSGILPNNVGIRSYNDTWQFNEDANSRTISVEHNISAVGLNTAISGTNAFLNALTFVRPKLGVSNMPIFLPQFTEPNASGGSVISTQPISTRRTESVDLAGGSYQATEVFVIASGNVTAFDQRTVSFEENDQKIATVNINGTVQGLGRTNYNLDGGVGFTNAYGFFQNTVRPFLPADASGVYVKYKSPLTGGSGLNIVIPITANIVENEFLGTVQYTFSYNDDPRRVLPSGIIELQTTVSRVEALRLFASHPIPFRRLGNIIQDIATTIEGSYTINSSARAISTGDKKADTNLAIATLESEINRVRPNAVDFITLRVDALNETYSDSELSAQVTLTYKFTSDLSEAPSADSPIILKYLS